MKHRPTNRLTSVDWLCYKDTTLQDFEWEGESCGSAEEPDNVWYARLPSAAAISNAGGKIGNCEEGVGLCFIPLRMIFAS